MLHMRFLNIISILFATFAKTDLWFWNKECEWKNKGKLVEGNLCLSKEIRFCLMPNLDNTSRFKTRFAKKRNILQNTFKYWKFGKKLKYYFNYIYTLVFLFIYQTLKYCKLSGLKTFFKELYRLRVIVN
jgi:hypothetical protein